MKTLDIKNDYTYKNEEKIKEFKNTYPDEDITLNIIDIKGFRYISVELLDEVNVSYKKYDHGYYLGQGDNPFFVLVKVDKDVASLKIHKDTKYVKDKALYAHNSIKELIVEADNVTFLTESVSCLKELEKVEFRGTGLVTFWGSAFANNDELKTVIFSEDATYDFLYKCFQGNRALHNFLLPRKIKSFDTAFEFTNIKMVFIPKNITNVRYVFNEDTEIFYEGECTEPTTETKVYESEDDYSFNFHRGPMSHTVITTPVKQTNHHTNVKYEDFLKLFNEQEK